MINYVLISIMLISVVFSVANGSMGELSNAVIGESINAVGLSITLMGGLAFWSGVMRVAEKSGITKALSHILSPITLRLFKGVKKSSAAMQYITMNIAANMFGLGNAATPLGIKAMRELYNSTKDEAPDAANNNMVIFTVLNTASIQLIPTTVATLRLKYGAANPMDIYPAILLTSLLSAVFGVGVAVLLNGCTKLGKLGK